MIIDLTGRTSDRKLPAGGAVALLCLLMVSVCWLGAGSAAARPDLKGPSLYMVQVEGLPSAYASTRALNRGAGDGVASSRARIQSDRNAEYQDEVVSAIERRDLAGDEVFRVTTAYNGVAVLAEPGDVARIGEIDGVRSVQRLPLARPANAFSMPYIGVDDLWAPGAGGLTGQGMRIGVIDTGLDYTHTDFGGSGSTADLNAARTAGNNPADSDLNPAGFTVARAGQQLYPSAKVGRGFDFAGDAYNADASGTSTPKPDANPMDCPLAEGGGHGTHVAGSAAGYGVNANGTTFTGSYAGLDPSGMRIGPGAAPEAKIYPLRIFGCDGSTALTVEALDWALDPNRDGDPSDRLDVLNLSLGSDFGLPDTPDARAVTAASRAGTVVVVAAGNGGNQIYQAGSPASSPQAITVANMVSSRLSDGFEVTLADNPSNNGLRPGSASVDFPWASLSTPVTGLIHYPASNRTGCSAFGPAASAAIAGKVVLLDWRSVRDDPDSPFACGSKTRVDNAEAAGAIGVVLADSATTSTIAIAGNSAIPSIYVVSPLHDMLRSEAQAGTARVTFSRNFLGNFRSSDEAGTVADSSSRGPGGAGVLKPDVAAPGTEIVSAAAGSGTGSQTFSGTSMASPHVAGLMALLRQAHPDWTVEELKALVMNTASDDLFSGLGQTGVPQPPQRVGTGTVNGPKAVDAGTLAYATAGDGAVGISFGPLEVPPGEPFSREASITVVNRENVQKNGVSAAFLARSTVPGATWSLPDGNTVDLPPEGSAQLTVRLDVPDPSALRNQKEETLLSGSNREWIAESSGLVRLTEPGGRTTTVPVYASLAPTSTLAAGITDVTLPEGATGGSFDIGGQAVDTGSTDSDFISLLTPLELQYSSPQIVLGPDDPPNLAAADIKNVGVGYDATADTVTFGISSWGNQPNPSDFAYHDVYIDTNENGVDDYVVYADRDPGVEEGDSFGTVVVRLPDGDPSFTLPTPVTSFVQSGRAFDSDVLTLTVPRSAIGLTPADSRFTYSIEGESPALEAVVGSTPHLTFDYLNPGISFGSPSIRPDVAGQLNFAYDDANMQANWSLGALLIHHMNASGSRDEAIAVTALRSLNLALAGPTSVNEGSVAKFTASATGGTGDPLSFAWDTGLGDGFSKAGNPVRFTPDDGPASIPVKVRATGGPVPAFRNRDLTVKNVAPGVRLRSSRGGRGRPRLRLRATDPSSADTAAGFDYAVDFGADGRVDRRPSGRRLNLAWPTGPRKVKVRVTATDKDGGTGKAVTLRRQPLKVCRVPRLKGLTLARARVRLRRAHCRLGRVERPGGATKGPLVVRSQSLSSGRVRPAGKKVNVRLGRRYPS